MQEAIKIVGVILLLALAFIGIAYFFALPSKLTEADLIGKIVKFEEGKLEKTHRGAKKLRGQHPKACGIVWAEFKVASDIPEGLPIGVFKEPHAPEDYFPAWIRFSKAIGDDDSSKMGGVGMAIKLMNVEGKKILECDHNSKTQDFLLFNSPVFFLRNIPDSISFIEHPILFFGSRWHEASILMNLVCHKNKSLMEQPYWSATPYQLGADKVVKYYAKPSVNNKYVKANKKETLEESLENQLKAHDVYFDFCIQVQKDPQKMPTEDPTIEWSEQESKFIKVATIRIPKQTFRSQEQQAFGENLSFTPWHSLPEHTPKGGINKVRKAVYLATAKFRRPDNGDEPTSDTFKPSLLVSLNPKK